MVTMPAPGMTADAAARRGVLGIPATAVRRARRSAASTPGRLFVIGVGLVVLALLTGVTAVFALQEKQATVDNLIAHREPVAAASQQIYRSLSDADATAASAFLSGGTPPPALRDRYELDIAQAGANLAKASADVAGVASAEAQVDELSQQLPVYTGLVETARAYNRQGYPAGAAYLREASGLMRAKLLPAAQALYSIDFTRLAAEQEQAREFPWVTVGLVVVLLAALVATQLYLTRRTNRLLNVGLLVATIAVIVGLGWGTVVLLLESTKVADGHDAGTRQVELAVQARITALKMRANETLTLVARGDGGEYEAEWKKLATEISGDDNLLARARAIAADGTVLGDAEDNVRDWLTAHEKVRDLDDGGAYQEAVALAIGDAKDGAAAAFNDLDGNLSGAINDGRAVFVDQTGAASSVMTALVPGVAVLALLAAAGVTMGIRERLQEYR
ncbi:MAG TPA: hypothetical protein VGP26_09050 [Actinophytocola sp.]|jgi:hypothetical protein|nr:hypothetical protein [Actinophytocola sp.]